MVLVLDAKSFSLHTLLTLWFPVKSPRVIPARGWGSFQRPAGGFHIPALPFSPSRPGFHQEGLEVLPLRSSFAAGIAGWAFLV